ncbi:uncharacterized protein LOC124177568 [Neodiprion fabricii]|uniref:uncharacterized protein LOC124177568 n=1 Tax=Neodiprion fabricii TaxID=2872261 RepID=UPI001ED9269B|nr:uncharacterized protein LOC124177568 [Neodiprion fabricii]
MSQSGRTLDSIAALLNENVDTLNAFINCQNTFNSNMTSKLNAIENIVKTVSDQGDRLAQLEASNVLLNREIDSLRDSLTNTPVNSSAQITIAGIPFTVTDNPLEVVTKVLTVLGVPELASDILDIRLITRRAPSSQNPERVNTSEASKSFIVFFKSSQISSHIIRKKRSHGVLAVSDVFACDKRGNIFVNEFLHPNTYNLLRKTEKIASDRNWKYVWSREGQIYARKQDGSQLIRITSEADLDKLG